MSGLLSTPQGVMSLTCAQVADGEEFDRLRDQVRENGGRITSSGPSMGGYLVWYTFPLMTPSGDVPTTV